MAPFDFHAFWLGLGKSSRSKLATDCEISVGYLQSGILYSRKIPRPESLERLAAATRKHDARASVPSLYLYFHKRYLEAAEPQPERAHG